MTEDFNRESEDLLDKFADGQVGPDEAGKLSEILKTSKDAREKLAWLLVVERLLRMRKSQPVPVEKIMGALPAVDPKTAKALQQEKDEPYQGRKKPVQKKERTGGRQIKETKRKVWNRSRSSYEQAFPMRIIAVLAICMVVMVGVWWKIGPKPEDRGQGTEDRGQGTEDRGQRSEDRGQRTGAGDLIVPLKEPEKIVEQKPEVVREKPKPLTFAKDVPDDDGAGEEDFVPPPDGLKKYETKAEKDSVARLAGRIGEASIPLIRSIKKSAPKSPVLIVKLKRGDRLAWDATPNDVDNLLRELKVVLDLNYIAEEKTMAELMADPLKRPVLYFSTHYRFSFTPKEREYLREYMLKGGMVILEAGMGSGPAYHSAINELGEILPDHPLQPLSPDHPIFRSYFDVNRIEYGKRSLASKTSGTAPRLDGITVNCRTLAVVSPWGLSIGWEGYEDEQYRACLVEDSRKLGVNMIAYAMAQRAWSGRSDMKVEEISGLSPGKMYVVQIIYDGEWKTRQTGLSVLLQTFNHKTDVEVKLNVRELRLSDPGIFDAPLLYITGHEDFYLSEAEALQLRAYLNKGGFLFAESCCGRVGFDNAFRAEMERVIQGGKMEVISPTNNIFRVPNDIGRVSVTPSLAAKGGNLLLVPRLEGIKIGDNYAVVYSKYGLAGGWDGSQNPYADGYNDIGAIHLGQNILMYAITH